MPQALQRWQRALRHLHEVIWHHNFDLDPGPGASCLYMELWPLEPLACVRLHIQVVPSGVTVRTAVCMEPQAAALSGEGVEPLLRSAVVACSTQPRFPVDPTNFSSRASSLRGVRVTLRRSLGQGTGSQPTEDMRDGSVCVWEGSFRFQDLVHLRDSALEALLPDGYLILRFSDGLCVPMDGLDPKGQQELLADSLSGTAAAAATSDQFPAAIELREVEQSAWVNQAIDIERRRRTLEAANVVTRSEVEARLKARAERLQHESTVLAHRHTLAMLAEQHSAALAALDRERVLRDEARAAIVAGERRLRGADAAREAIEEDNELTRVALPTASRLVRDLGEHEGSLRRSRLLELAEALPLERLGGSSGGGVAAWGVDGSTKLVQASSASPDQRQAALSAAPPADTTSLGGRSAAQASGQAGISMSIGSSSDEEELAAVLGGAAQLTVNVARLLSLALRYPIRLGGSRSSIEERPLHLTPGANGGLGGGATAALPSSMLKTSTMPVLSKALTYPLYSKGVDSLKVQHGVLLLGRNIQQLLHALDELPPHPPRHILPALHLLFQRMAAKWPLAHTLVCDESPPSYDPKPESAVPIDRDATVTAAVERGVFAAAPLIASPD